ncbi:DNA replication complex GINS protein PSF3-like [Artemia franciscana]|uniref:DNA replication complex GINS protein PSF3 n=1 Tax=Artemia franciscana TaxID=6661 RepID=A0AA88LAP1_ARTSF|nr:hypothetical protein QYM36_001949 [Artemia franciscana]KAK2723447.1 hypothetical protein QYM36_001949 [Artemia franciscana]KAK2723448.1 hypothetical protein QYM36_001949 [Artemia franciscana]KAK2723449.1 hypothetical protein QYM36_001949 [Artemia franciscana]KAK2723450.1 hypothetical protein QYM36_001949 [Artemia franciscana]
MNLELVYCPNYFSIDDIAATEERVLCKFERPVLKLGSLDPSSDSPDVVAGTKLELPFWLASFLFKQRIVSIEVPKFYKDYYREILNADPSVVDLKKWGPHYYELGLHLQRLNIREQSDIRKILYDALRLRTRNILDSSLHSRQEEQGNVSSILDSLEKKLYEAGRKAALQFESWLTGESEKIVASSLIEKSRKRKLAEIE